VDLPKNSDGKTLALEKMDLGKYEEAFLKSAFREVGLNNVTLQEINNFQREYNTLTNKYENEGVTTASRGYIIGVYDGAYKVDFSNENAETLVQVVVKEENVNR